MSFRSDLVDVDADLIHETEKAYLIDDGKQRDWVPKAVVEWDKEAGTFAMPLRLAMQKGFV